MKRIIKINEKYNPDNLFKSINRRVNENNTNMMIEYKESILQRIIAKIKSLWKALIKK